MAAWCTNGTGRANHAPQADFSLANATPFAGVTARASWLGCRNGRREKLSSRRQKSRFLPAGLTRLMGWPAESAAGAFGQSN